MPDEQEISKVDTQNVSQSEDKEQKFIAEIEQFYSQHTIQETLSDASPDHDVLNNPSKFYESIMRLGGEHSVRLQQYIFQFLEQESASSDMRMKVIGTYWNFYIHLLGPDGISQINKEIRYFIRYNILVTSAVAPLILNIISKTDMSYTPEKVSIYYLDEWMERVSAGKISSTQMDETAMSAESLMVMQRGKITELTAQKKSLIGAASGTDKEIADILVSIEEIISKLQLRKENDFGFLEAYSDEEMQRINSLISVLTQLKSKNAQLSANVSKINTLIMNVEKAKNDLQTLIKENPDIEVDTEGLDSDIDLLEERKSADKEESTTTKKVLSTRLMKEEIKAIRQMIKMCVGKRGNHFPILVSHYFLGPEKNMGTRERVYNLIHAIEAKDYSAFRRERHGVVTRVFPLIILLPIYGNHGICWEPFDRANRSTSSSRLAIPMYAQDLELAIMEAIADYRWQYAKERAGIMWMEEGLTGWFFQWFDSTIKKGDVKQVFIRYYIDWIKWESTGVQKLTKEVRNIFWRYLPFPHALKEALVKRSSVYGKLLQKDTNREISFGITS